MIALLAPRRLRLAADHRRRFGAIGLVTHVTDVRRSFPRIESYRVAHHQLARPTTAREAYDQFHGNCVLVSHYADRAPSRRSAPRCGTRLTMFCILVCSALAGLVFQERKNRYPIYACLFSHSGRRPRSAPVCASVVVRPRFNARAISSNHAWSRRPWLA
jgi:hypothetical protein